jgi:hypothetical protein
MTDILEIKKEDNGVVTVFHLAGRLDGQSEGQLLEETRLVHQAGARFLMIDLTELEMLTSAGLRAFHTIFKMFTPQEEMKVWEKEHSGEPYKSKYFKLAGANPRIYYVLSLSGFLHNIPIYADVKEALNSF